MSIPLLITGAAGYLGRRVAALAASRWPAAHVLLHHTPTAVALPAHYLDLHDAAAVDALLDSLQPQAIIHTAAMSPAAGDRMTPAALWSTNVVGAANLARWASRNATRLVAVSSDAIWGGRAEPYRESDAPAPINPYGASKAAAEAVIQTLHPAATRVRTSLIYGTDPPDPNTLMAWELANGRREGVLFTDEYRCPIFLDDLANALLELVEVPWTGPLNLVGPQALSRLELGAALLRWAGYSHLRLPSGSAQASGLRRPSRVVVESDHAAQLLQTRLRSIDEVAAQEAYRGRLPEGD